MLQVPVYSCIYGEYDDVCGQYDDVHDEDDDAEYDDPRHRSVEQVFGPESVAAGPVYDSASRLLEPLGWKGSQPRSQPEEPVIVRFENLRLEDYREGWADAPTLRWTVLCPKCHDVFLWRARADVRVAPDVLARSTDEALFDLGYTRLEEPDAGSEILLLESVDCRACRAIAVRWMAIKLRDGAFQASRIVELTPAQIERAHVISNDCVVEAAARAGADREPLSVRAAIELLRLPRT